MKLNGNTLPASWLSDAAVGQLESFKQRLETNQVISRQDVLSIEEFIGTGIITQKLPINSFTLEATSINHRDVLEIVSSEIANGKSLEKDITYAELSYQIYKARNNTDNLLSTLRKIEQIPNSVMDRFINEKYIFSYINENNEETTEVIDTTSKYSIFQAIAYNTKYLNAVLETAEISEDTRGYVISDLRTYIDSNWSKALSDDLMILPLLTALCTRNIGMALYNHNIPLDVVTIRDMHAMYKDIGNIINDVKNTLSSIESDLSNQMDITWSVAGDGNKELVSFYKRYTNFNNVLEHVPSNVILRFFRRLASK